MLDVSTRITSGLNAPRFLECIKVTSDRALTTASIHVGVVCRNELRIVVAGRQSSDRGQGVGAKKSHQRPGR